MSHRDYKQWCISLASVGVHVCQLLRQDTSDCGKRQNTVPERTHTARIGKHPNISTIARIHGWTVCWLSFYLHSPCGSTRTENRLSILVADAPLFIPLFLWLRYRPPKPFTINLSARCQVCQWFVSSRCSRQCIQEILNFWVDFLFVQCVISLHLRL